MSTQDQLPAWQYDTHAVIVAFVFLLVVAAFVAACVFLVAAWLGRITA